MYLAAMIIALMGNPAGGELSYGTASWKAQVFRHLSSPTSCGDYASDVNQHGKASTSACYSENLPLLTRGRCCLAWQTKKWTDASLTINNYFPIEDAQSFDLMDDKVPNEIREKISGSLVRTPVHRGFTLGEKYSDYPFDKKLIFGKQLPSKTNYYAVAQLIRGGYDRGISLLHTHLRRKVPDGNIAIGLLPVCQLPKIQWNANGTAKNVSLQSNSKVRISDPDRKLSGTLDFGQKNWDIEYLQKLTGSSVVWGRGTTFGFNLVDAKGDEGVVDLVRDHDGHLILLGWAKLDGKRKIVLTRWKTTITQDSVSVQKDTSFGSGGMKIHELEADVVPVGAAVDSKGRILVGGKIKLAGRKVYDRLFVTRFKSNGSPDTGFGFASLAVASTPANRASSATGFAVDSKDRALIVGNNATGPMIARFTERGRLDKSLGGKGWKSLSRSFRAEALLVDQMGRLVMAGYKKSGGRAVQAQIWRYLSNGNVDKSFGQGGVVKFSGNRKHAQSIALGSRGRLIVAGKGFSASIRNGKIEDQMNLAGSNGAQVRVRGDQVIRLSW